MFVRIALLATVVGLAGCDVVEEVQPTEGVPFTFSTVRVEGLRLAPTRNREWDEDGTTADVFIEIQNAAGATLAQSGTAANADLTQPLEFTFEQPGEASSVTSSLFVVAFDNDGDRFDSETMGSSVPFSLSDVPVSGGEVVLADIRSDRGREATYTIVR